MKINLRSLSRGISQKFSIPEETVGTILKEFIHEIAHRIKNGEMVHIKSFATFFMRNHKGRTVVNPQTKEKMEYSDTVTPRVKFSSTFKDFIRKGVDK